MSRARFLRRLLFLWIALTVLSNVFRATSDVTRQRTPLPEGYRVVDLNPLPEDLPPVLEPVELEAVQMAYWEVPAEGEARGTIVYLHGNPMASDSFNGIVPYLDPQYRHVFVDLPGFGHSTLDPHAVSLRAHAAYLKLFLDAINLGRVHLVGYSMGGGVSLKFSDAYPQRVASLTLLSSIGLVDYELFGSDDLNHLIYFVQHALVRGATWLVPHFGALDYGLVNLSFARNFVQSDFESIRQVLPRIEAPVLLLHGTRDRVVPVEAAMASHQLLARSRLEQVEGGHLVVMRDPAPVAHAIMRFVRSVDSGRFVAEQTDPARRIPRAPLAGLALFTLFALLAAATFISEDLTCITAGLLAAQGTLPLPYAIAACFTGIFISDLALFAAGRWCGRAAVRRAPLRWFLSEGKVRHASAWFHRKGPFVIIASRFLPGTRLATYFTAGLLHTSLRRFVFFFGIGALLWTPIIVGVSKIFGRQLLHYYERWEAFTLPVVLLAVFCLYVFFHYVLPLSNWRGRRLLLSRWRRFSRWEFWPLWRVNAPVLLYVVWQTFVRYRRPTLFTITNPGIPHSGFLGESKAQILSELKGAGDAVARWILLSPEDTPEKNLVRLKRWMEREELHFPVVLKPDAGERGLAVARVECDADVLAYLGNQVVPVLAQEYVEGQEFGVFYIRRPSEAKGQIFSLTRKELIRVVADGHRSLEELILADARAVCLAPMFIERFGGRAFDVPERGEPVTLVEVGTHARGALFLDARAEITPAMEDAFENIARSFKGFYFGRFDVRVPELEDLRQGRNIRVIELNGITSEATHIYDPALGIWNAWRTLITQWRIALEIAAANAEAGFEPWTLRRFVAHWVQAARQRRRVEARMD